MKKDKWQKMETIFELLVFGIAVGVIEDLIAIKFATGEPITYSVIVIVILVAIPFAVLGEVFFDKIDFASLFKKWFEKK